MSGRALAIAGVALFVIMTVLMIVGTTSMGRFLSYALLAAFGLESCPAARLLG